MTIKLIVFLGLLCSFTFNSFAQSSVQCDSIIFYNREFDKYLQNEYRSIKADSVLVIRHNNSTNGCNNNFGLLCWKTNGHFYFKMVKRNKRKITSSNKLDEKLKQHLIVFYNNKIFETIGEGSESNLYYIDDGPLTSLLFRTHENCWRFEYLKSASNNVRAVWTNELLNLMRK